MIRAAFAAVAFALTLASQGQAQGFDPFHDYHITGQVDFGSLRAAAPAQRQIRAKKASAQAGVAGLPALPAPGGAHDENDAPQASPTLKAAPAVLDGGPRPAIAPETPSVVSHALGYGAGSVVIDTKGRQLLYLISGSQAYRYPISVGRVGFTWTGTQKISRVANWPDWHPPAEMRQRDPRLPEKMTGGLRNPLGARALYLGNSLYRIHGTNDARSIGLAASSGCFRMRNAHVLHLSQHAHVGTTVHVLSALPGGGARRKVAGTKPGEAG